MSAGNHWQNITRSSISQKRLIKMAIFFVIICYDMIVANGGGGWLDIKSNFYAYYNRLIGLCLYRNQSTGLCVQVPQYKHSAIGARLSRSSVDHAIYICHW